MTEQEQVQAHMPKGYTARIEREPGLVRVLALKSDGEAASEWSFEIDDDEVRIVYKVQPHPFVLRPARGDLQHCLKSLWSCHRLMATTPSALDGPKPRGEFNDPDNSAASLESATSNAATP